MSSFRIRLVLLTALLVAAFGLLGRASARAQFADQYPTEGWFAQYWENTELQGQPFSSGFAETIDNRWGLGQPLPGQDTFSVRWTRSAYFPGGVYRFVATMDDGMRIWVDGQQIIDAWAMSVEHVVSKDVPIAQGWHNLRVDYHDVGGVATAVLNWTPISGGNTYPNWKAEYFANSALAGTPVLVRDDRYLDFNWGYGTPDLRVPADNFSARWTHTFIGVPGQYRLDLTSDDGARLYVNDQLIIDNWNTQAAKTKSADYWFSGPAKVRVDYFEARGSAMVRVDIVPVSGGEGLLPPPPTPTPVPPTFPPGPDGTVTCNVQPTATTGVVISARPLNVRAAPTTSAAIIALLQPCAQPLLTGNRSADGLWAEVLTDGGQVGWVLLQYLQTAGDTGGGVG